MLEKFSKSFVCAIFAFFVIQSHNPIERVIDSIGGVGFSHNPSPAFHVKYVSHTVLVVNLGVAP